MLNGFSGSSFVISYICGVNLSVFLRCRDGSWVVTCFGYQESLDEGIESAAFPPESRRDQAHNARGYTVRTVNFEYI